MQLTLGDIAIPHPPQCAHWGTFPSGEGFLPAKSQLIAKKPPETCRVSGGSLLNLELALLGDVILQLADGDTDLLHGVAVADGDAVVGGGVLVANGL